MVLVEDCALIQPHLVRPYHDYGHPIKAHPYNSDTIEHIHLTVSIYDHMDPLR